MYKKKHNYTCLICKKDKTTTDPNRVVCNKCKKWNKPGEGQLELI